MDQAERNYPMETFIKMRKRGKNNLKAKGVKKKILASKRNQEYTPNLSCKKVLRRALIFEATNIHSHKINKRVYC